MTKELEALERIKKWFPFKVNELEYLNICIIETALKRLKELEKAFHTLSKDDEKAKELLSLEIEKNRAFEIIKEKRVNAGNFIDMLEDWNSITYEDWLNYKEENGYYLQDELNELEFGVITKEDFNLLKEVLL